MKSMAMDNKSSRNDGRRTHTASHSSVTAKELRAPRPVYEAGRGLVDEEVATTSTLHWLVCVGSRVSV